MAQRTQGDQCVFCQLMQQPDQLNLVGETENFYAWLEYPTPRAKGQANIVPKEHIESVMEFSPKMWNEAFNLVREVMEKQFEALDADGLSLVTNVKEAGGQMLPHAYIQLFPRFEDDENAGTPAGAIFQQDESLQGSVEDVREQMNQVEVDWGVEEIEPDPRGQKHVNGDSETREESEGEPEEEKDDEDANSQRAGTEGFDEEVDGSTFEWK